MEENSDLALEQPVPQRADPKGADPLLRTGAFAIDATAVGAVCWLWNLLVWRMMPVQATWLVFAGVIVLVIAYYGWATARRNHTPGQVLVAKSWMVRRRLSINMMTRFGSAMPLVVMKITIRT